jgi:hypothetical protein
MTTVIGSRNDVVTTENPVANIITSNGMFSPRSYEVKSDSKYIKQVPLTLIRQDTLLRDFGDTIEFGCQIGTR